MNLPNKLTMIRMVLVIPFVIFLLVTPPPKAFPWFALIIFIGASITDHLDGKIARRDNLITDFGKFMDPLADKLLVGSAMIALTALGRLSAYVTIIIIAREFVISGFRLVASDNQIVIAASIWGKVKTVCQMAMVILLLLTYALEVSSTRILFTGFYRFLHLLTVITVIGSVVLTILSLADYIWKNRQVLSTER